MHDLSVRLKPIVTNTPPRVGPALYTLPDFINGKATQQPAPFLSSKPRSIVLTSPDAPELPGAADYHPRYRKHRILGGTSLRNRAFLLPKLKKSKKLLSDHALEQPGPATYNVYHTHIRRQGVGKLYLCRPPRLRKTNPTIPEKGLICYDYRKDGDIMKIVKPPGDTTLGPCFYRVPQGETCYNTKKYKGNNWSLMNEERFKSKTDNMPGPAEYNLLQKVLPPHKVVQESISEKVRNLSRQDRYLDTLVNRTTRENLPGPGSYDITTPGTTKSGTFSKAPRGNAYQLIEGPGPAAYSDPRSAVSKAFKYTSYHNSAFMVDAPRSAPAPEPSPGPSDYDPSKGLSYDLQKKYYPEITKHTPFSTTAIRNTVPIKPDSKYTLGPAEYNLQKTLATETKRNYMFGSQKPRFAERVDNVQATCASYSIEEAFNTIKNPKSHLKSKKSAFLTTSPSCGFVRPSCAPAPNMYNPPDSSLKLRSCVFPRDVCRNTIQVSPGPADYTIHPKIFKPFLFSHNVTLQPGLKLPTSFHHKMLMALKKRGFITNMPRSK